jgi:hypothetical protein
MTTPVVFIHWGNVFEYQHLASLQATKFCPKVITFREPLMKHTSMEIARWFVLRDYMFDDNIDRAVYLDSDVLLFTSPINDFKDCDLAFSKYHSGHIMFVNNRDALDDFCVYIDANYRDTSLIKNTRLALPGHLFPDSMGDMVLLNNFALDRSWVILDTSKPVLGTIYSHNYNTEKEGIVRNNEHTLPEYTDELGNTYGMNSIHFQGGAKSSMKEFINV